MASTSHDAAYREVRQAAPLMLPEGGDPASMQNARHPAGRFVFRVTVGATYGSLSVRISCTTEAQAVTLTNEKPIETFRIVS